MKLAIFITCVFFSSFTFANPNWIPKVQSISDNGDGTVTLEYPYRRGPMNDANVCEYSQVGYGKLTNKSRLCRTHGFKNYVKGSVIYTNDSYSMASTRMERIFCGGVGCCGAPEQKDLGIESVRCKK